MDGALAPAGQAPAWFERALAVPRESRHVDVDGCAIHYLSWGVRSKPGLVLVHGGAAHAEWWAFLAPMLASAYHVVALDLSGHGDSGRRADYGYERWRDEILAVADHSGMVGPFVIVGHSMGGLVSIVTAAQRADRLAGAVIVDSPVRRPAPEATALKDRLKAFHDLKRYPTMEAALARFRLIPEQPCDHGFIVRFIAERSLRQDPAGGWSWKFDPNVFNRPVPQLSEQLAAVRTRVALFRGEHSRVVPEETSEYMYQLLGRNAPVVEIPDAHHHLLLDQPLAFVAALRALLADWEHSLPRRAP